jgi:hypothetical protein
VLARDVAAGNLSPPCINSDHGMTKHLTFTLLTLGGLLAAAPAFGQGATGAISRPGWSAGQAPSSDFNRQGVPMTRNEQVRQRAAAARGQAVQASQPRRAAGRRVSR